MQTTWFRIQGFSLTLFAVIATLSCARAAHAGDDVFSDINAEYAYRIGYSAQKKHKAFAIGPHAAFGFSYNWPSVKKAERDALAVCELDLRNSFKKGLPDRNLAGKCKLLASDDKLLLPAPWIGAAWQIPLEGPDVPFERGKSSIYHGPSPRGILLYVHGCDGLGWNKAHEIYADFFNALGFSYFAPDSFADPRPAAICGKYPLSKRRDETVVAKLRVAQTLRTIRDLKIKYPNQPVYLWGHSEGGYIVKMLDVDVAGIITSGDACDVSGFRMLAPKSVPVMIMNGENDPFHGSFALPLTVKKMQRCRSFVRNSKTQIVVLKNNEHDIYPWRPEFYRTVPKFLGVDNFEFPADLPAKKINLDNGQQAGMAAYSSKANHRAFAATSHGAFSWTSEWKFAEDAEQYALYDCAAVDKLNVFAFKSQHCVLVDLDGKKTEGN